MQGACTEISYREPEQGSYLEIYCKDLAWRSLTENCAGMYKDLAPGLLARSVYRDLVEGSLEVKLPTIWTDEKQSREEAERRERLEERRSEKRKIRREKIKEEKESEERRCRCAKR